MTATINPESLDRTIPASPTQRRSGARDRTAETRELFMRALSTRDEQERRRLHESVIVLHLDLAHAEASRYRSRGVPLDDLRQVAAMALTKATRGYDVTTGHDFLSYAVPTIRGELRKHFRDHGWMIRPPRRIQELQARINVAESELSNKLGRSPQPTEIAHHLQECPESVIEALASDGCFLPAALDDASKTQHLFGALGWADDELAKLAHENWARVLRATWKG